MQLSGPTEPITADDDTIRRALAEADIPALLPSLAYITGDLSLLRDDLRPDSEQLFDPAAGLTAEQQEEARQLAHDVLVRYRDSGCRPGPPATIDDIQEMLEFLVGGSVSMEDYLPLFREELGVEGEDMRAPDWHLHEVAPHTDFRVAVIGGGMSGIAAAHRLQQAAVPFVVLEKNGDVGGTWLENTYPGCRVDVPNHLYSYSFAQRDDWSQHYSTQEVLLDYFRQCAERFELREHVRFHTEVTSVEWSDETCTYTLCLRNADGSEELLEANAVISAVGQLNRPSFPDIPGRQSFAGPWFHSADWDHEVDLKGKRVGVIGTGASAVQFVPGIADTAGEVLVFQRTPPWLIPTPDYHAEVPDGFRWLLHHVPSYAQWYRFWQFWRMSEGLLPAVQVDPDWDHPERSVSAANDLVRELLAGYIQAMFAGSPELIDHVVPDYPPGAKRMLRDNGIWPTTLQRDDVRLICDPIEEITPSGIRTADGTDHEVDVLIYGTGFQASHFLTPMKVVGRGGVDIHEQWDGDARAYLGVTVPGFPNFFMLYGPNTNIVVNGSIIYFSECEVHYVMEHLRHQLAQGHRALDVRPEVHDAYNQRIDEGNRQMAWGASGVNTWYKNERGRITQNWPFTLREYWQQTREVDAADYEAL